MNQHTIQDEVSLSGVGLHTGQKVTLTFKPAVENHGVKFLRVDLEDAPVLPADVSKVVSTNRGTTIKYGEAKVNTVEHLLSALMGLQIDNVLVEIDGPEVPIMDGTAQHFVDVLKKAGKVEQAVQREFFVITEPISYRDESTGIELMAVPADEFQVTSMIDFNSETLGQQYASLESISEFENEIAPCRTFVFLHELEPLFDQNLIKGGDLDNAIVIVDRMMSEEELNDLKKKLGQPDIKVEKEGILNTTKLKFNNEPARHKLLDVIGDLALVGCPIKGKIVATKPGHTANVEFAKILKTHWIKQKKLKGKPNYNPNQEPLMDTVKIMDWLPHKHPFLLVDKIIELSDHHVVGIKNITFDEPFFPGHFPGNPVMPGVLQIEAMAQTGGILALSTVEDPGNWDTYFLKIDNCKFKQKVVPGDTLLIKLEMMNPIRRGICQMLGTAYVGDKLVSEAELTAQIIRRPIEK